MNGARGVAFRACGARRRLLTSDPGSVGSRSLEGSFTERAALPDDGWARCVRSLYRDGPADRQVSKWNHQLDALETEEFRIRRLASGFT
jgi:hypothetical protein